MTKQRLNIVFSTLFFMFAFCMLFFALLQNYVHASIPTILPVRIAAVLDASGAQTTIEHDIVPDFGQEHAAPSEHISEFDFVSDDSFQKYLNSDHPFLDDSYIPTDLVVIESDFTANNARKFQLRQEAAIQFADMARHFRNTFSGDRLFITSTYRSKGFQDYLIRQGCALLRCAKVGTSEHQAGLALDLKVITKGGKGYSLDVTYPNKYYDWLKTHASEFGFHNTYQRGVDIDGKMAEGRHRRYLGMPLATLLADNSQTFAEYYATLHY